MDAFVLPSRGEGWGRPHTEAMAMRLPVIATAWSGPTEFMTSDNSYPLPIRGLVRVGGNSHFATHSWADPDPDALVDLLRTVHTSLAENAARGARARADMVANFSNDAIGKLLADHLDRILSNLAERAVSPESGHDEL